MKCASYKNKKGQEIDFHLKVWTRPNLRDGTHEMFLYVGRPILENIFDKKQIDEHTKEICIRYPETWCNIPELQCLVDWIPHFYPNIEKLDIETHSVYILQTVRKEHIGIYDKPDSFPCTSENNPLTHFAPTQQPFKGLWANGKKISN